ncbi:MAG: caspase family protein [Firmicutes bacterium]|jgi:hypothetical protein|nr:caspase family protein [Bacillota bacterium]MDH7495768.1 caspase family protein [Bacillota bacterium]
MLKKSTMALRLAALIALLAATLALTGCFGGGRSTLLYGSIDGYVYQQSDARGTEGGDGAGPKMMVSRSSKAPKGYIPLQGATVVAVPGGKTVYSNSQGYFRLTMLDPGWYDVSITHERFINGLMYPDVQVVAGRTTHLEDAQLGSFFYLIIGINDYPGDPGDDDYHDLRFAVADAELLEETLWSINGYAGEVELLTDGEATKAGILAAIQEIGSKMSEYGQDYFVMTFSGHGGHQPDPDPDPAGDYEQEYIVAADDEVITDDELADWIQSHIPTDFCLFIFDSCHSGGMTKGVTRSTFGPAWMKDFRPGLSGLARDLNKYGYVVLMASDDDEVSYEDETLDGGHGIFTYYLCNGIKTRAADTSPSDDLITAREAFNYAKPLVQNRTTGYPYGSQTPQLYAEPTERGDIPIYRVP